MQRRALRMTDGGAGQQECAARRFVCRLRNLSHTLNVNERGLSSILSTKQDEAFYNSRMVPKKGGCMSSVCI